MNQMLLQKCQKLSKTQLVEPSANLKVTELKYCNYLLAIIFPVQSHLLICY